MLTHKHLKKKSESLKIEHCPIDQKLFKFFFFNVTTPKLSLYRTQTPTKSSPVFLQIFYIRAQNSSKYFKGKYQLA